VSDSANRAASLILPRAAAGYAPGFRLWTQHCPRCRRTAIPDLGRIFRKAPELRVAHRRGKALAWLMAAPVGTEAAVRKCAMPPSGNTPADVYNLIAVGTVTATIRMVL